MKLLDFLKFIFDKLDKLGEENAVLYVCGGGALPKPLSKEEEREMLGLLSRGENADQIKDFLGNFQAVTLTSLPNVCGLVYQKGERLFEVKYFTLQIENGKIVDVQG